MSRLQTGWTSAAMPSTRRIRLTGEATAANAEVERIIAGVTACPPTSTELSVTASPWYPGLFKVVSGLGSDDELVSWVAVVDERAHTSGTTIFLAEGAGLVDGFAELDRLVADAVHQQAVH